MIILSGMIADRSGIAPFTIGNEYFRIAFDFGGKD
jgi:hypothetical protein